MRLLIILDLDVEIGQGLSAGHEIGDLLSGLLTAHEVRSQSSANKHGVVIAYGHRMGDLVGDEDHSEAALAGLQHDAQDVRGLLYAKSRSRFVKDQHPGAKMHRPRDGQRLPLAAGEAADQPVAVIYARDPEFLEPPSPRFHWQFCGRRP